MCQPTDSLGNAPAIKNYAENAARLVPGLHDLRKMTALLVTERATASAKVLVVGAGGGLELKELAQSHPQWRFVGVDPFKPMLELAETTLGPLMTQVELHLGTTETAPAGLFDAATCLLTMHFLNHDQRRATLHEIRRRLVPGAPLIVAHFSFPQAPEERPLWLSRYVAFAVASGFDPEQAQNAATAIGLSLPLLSPEQDEALLAEAGFTGTRLFYAGMTFRGWVAYA